ncbi:MAG: hypothetical protein WCP70_08040 [Methanothrix sp.]
MADLWPNDIGNATQKAPLSILQEQASILGAKTKNLVEAEVRVSSAARVMAADSKNKRVELGATIKLATKTGEELASSLSDKADDISKDYLQLFVYDFLIAAPVLNNYSFRIFTVAYDFRLYPVKFILDKDIQDEIGNVWGTQNILAKSEDELSSILMQIFSSNKVRGIINALLVQSGGSIN